MTQRALVIDLDTGIKGHADFPTAGSPGVPTWVRTGDTYVVPVDYQVVAHLPIRVDGDISLEGDLVLI